jgi:hypothetical protein
MVYVIPTSLVINPSSITTASVVTATVSIAKNISDSSCNIPFLWTKTNIYLLMKTPSQSWNQATLITTKDCTSVCCLTGVDSGVSSITFDQFSFNDTGTFNIMAIDQGYWIDGNYSDLSAVATATVNVTLDQSTCLENPCTPGCPSANCTNCPSMAGCGGTSCASGDIICELMKTVTENPLILIGGVIVLAMLMPSGRRR